MKLEYILVYENSSEFDNEIAQSLIMSLSAQGQDHLLQYKLSGPINQFSS